QHGRTGTARDHRLELASAAHPTGQLQQLAERRAQRDLVIARQLHIARDRKQFGAAGVGDAKLKILLRAVAENPGNSRKGFGVVDGGGLAVQTETCREWRLEPGLALLALQ